MKYRNPFVEKIFSQGCCFSDIKWGQSMAGHIANIHTYIIIKIITIPQAMKYFDLVV